MHLASARRSVFPAANRKKEGDKTKALLQGSAEAYTDDFPAFPPA